MYGRGNQDSSKNQNGKKIKSKDNDQRGEEDTQKRTCNNQNSIYKETKANEKLGFQQKLGAWTYQVH